MQSKHSVLVSAMTYINVNRMLVLLILLICNVNSHSEDTSMNMTTTSLEECVFNITLAEIGNPVTQYCPNKRKNKHSHEKDDNKSKGNRDSNENRKYNKDNRKSKRKSKDNKSDSLDDDSNDRPKRRPKFVTTCIKYTITGQITHTSDQMSIFLPLCPQHNDHDSHDHNTKNIQVSDISQLITNDTFKNGSNIENAIGYSYDSKLGILVQLIDETVTGFELCIQDIKQKSDKSLDIEKIGISEGIVSIQSTNATINCEVHGLPCFKFNFKERCDRKQFRNEYNVTNTPDDEIFEENELLNDYKNSDDGTLSVFFGVSKATVWALVGVLIGGIIFVIAYLISVCKRRKSDDYHSTVTDDKEDDSGNEGGNTEFERIITKL